MAAVLWSIWKTRNRACFDGIMPADPCDIVFQIYHYIDYWSNLQKTRIIRALQQLGDEMKMIAKTVFNRTRGWVPTCQRIGSGLHFVRSQCVWALLEGGKAPGVKLKWNFYYFSLLLPSCFQLFTMRCVASSVVCTKRVVIKVEMKNFVDMNMLC
jgi:hypothetical protein